MDVSITQRKKIIQYGLWASVLVVGFMLLKMMPGDAEPMLIEFLEQANGLLVIVIGIVSMIRYFGRRRPVFLLVGIAFLLMSVFSVILAMSLWPSFEQQVGRVLPWISLMDHTFLSLMFALGGWFWLVEARKPSLWQKMGGEKVFWLVGPGLVTGCILLLFFIARQEGIPSTYLMNLPLEAIPGIFFLVALIGFFRKGRWKESVFEHGVIIFLISMILSEIPYLLSARSFFDLYTLGSLVVQTLGYAIFLISILANTYQLVQEAEASLLETIAVNKRQEEEILERKRVQRELDNFFSLSLDMLCIAGMDGYFKRLNPAFEEILGYSREELLSRPFLDFVHPDDLEATMKEVEKLADGFSTVDFENRYQCTDGSFRWLTWRAYPTSEGTIYATAHDITSLKQARDAVEEGKGRIQAILDTTVDGIITINRRGIIQSFNQAAERIFGYQAIEVIGQNVKILMPSPYHEEHDGYVRKYQETSVKKVIGIGREVVGQRKDGSVFPMDLAVSEVRLDDGERIIYSGIVRDITERVEAKRQRARLIEELKVANTELNEFAYIISHDLKAPLRAIGSLSSWLKSDYAEQIDDKGQELIAMLAGRVQRMHNLIEGVLHYSRAGRVREVLEEVNLDILLQETITFIAPPPHVTITVETPLPTVMCEPTRIGQVFQNLLTNAIKYGDKPQGIIRVGCEEVDGFWQFYVSDNGCGIEEKYFIKIFQIFQTLNARDEVESTGVGLSIIKKIVELNGGRIWLTSVPKEGTTFYFTLPQTYATTTHTPALHDEGE